VNNQDLLPVEPLRMKPSPSRCFGCFSLVIFAVVFTGLPMGAAYAAAPSVKAFPSAEGFGANARGGRGGRIIEVTNLNDAGAGSLRNAMEASRPRICVFRVSGTITLKNAIRVSSPYLTVGNGGPIRIDGKPADAGGTKLYLTGNWGPRAPNGSTNDWSGHGVNTWDYYEFQHDGNTHWVKQSQYDAIQPFPVPPVKLDSPSNLLDTVLATVGASKPWRDSIDQRIIQSVRDKNGTSHGGTTGPWPDLASGAPQPPIDSDHDGMPDAWEVAHELNPKNASDGARFADNGYTHVENYLNELAGDSVSGPAITIAEPASTVAGARNDPPYMTYSSFTDLMAGKDDVLGMRVGAEGRQNRHHAASASFPAS
jgi:hypothetical protein